MKRGKEMKKKAKALLGPIITAAVLILYGAGYLAGCLLLPLPIWIKVAGGAVMAAGAALLIFVTIERIKEIRSGENDDLGNY